MGAKWMGPSVGPLTTTSVLCVLFAGIMVVLWQGLCACGDGTSAKKTATMSNLKQLGLAHALYVQDWDGYGPFPDTWMDQTYPYVKNRDVYRSRHESILPNEFGFAYYSPLGPLRESEMADPDTVPLIFESVDKRWNAHGDLTYLPAPPRWDAKVNCMVFLDGHVMFMKAVPKFTLETEK